MRSEKISLKREYMVRAFLGPTAIVSVITTLTIVIILFKEATGFFKEIPVTDFLFGTNWAPLIEPKSFGVLPLVTGTFLVTAGAAFIAIPLGLLTAFYLSVYAKPNLRDIIKPILEILAGIPTIVYGYFALTFVTPALKIIFPEIEVFNALSGAIVVGIMILPMVSSLCDDCFREVPGSVKEGAYALGATSFEVSWQITLPYSLSRVLASFILAISRAIGETMAVTLASGANPQLTFNPLKSIQTMTAYIVQISLGDVQASGVEYYTCYAVGILLFAITLGMNLFGHAILAKYRRV